MSAIDVERLAPGLRVGAHDRVQGLIFGPRIVAAVIAYSVFARLRQAEQFGGRQVLVAKEDDEVVEPRPTDRRDRIVVELLREIDPENLRADCSRKRAYVEFVPGHAPCYRHAPGAPSPSR